MWWPCPPPATTPCSTGGSTLRSGKSFTNYVLALLWSVEGIVCNTQASNLLHSNHLFRKDVEKSNCLIELQPIENEGPSQNRPFRDKGDQTRDSFMDIVEGNTQS